MSRHKYHLFRRRLPKNHRWQHDFDYLDQLSEDEKSWLNQFVKEYYDGNVPKTKTDNLHNTDELRRDCYDRKNRQNRDLQSIMDCRGKMTRHCEKKDKKVKD